MVAATPAAVQAKILEAFFELQPFKEFLQQDPIWGGSVLEHLIARAAPACQPAILKKFTDTQLAELDFLGDVEHFTLEVMSKMDPAARSAGYDAVIESEAYQRVKKKTPRMHTLDFEIRLAALLPETDTRMIGHVWLDLDEKGQEAGERKAAVCLGTQKRPEIYLVGEGITSPHALLKTWRERAHRLEVMNDECDTHDVSGYACGYQYANSYVLSCEKLSRLFAGAADKLKESMPKAARHLTTLAQQQPFEGRAFGRQTAYART
jgi:hypothetical protein